MTPKKNPEKVASTSPLRGEVQVTHPAKLSPDEFGALSDAVGFVATEIYERDIADRLLALGYIAREESDSDCIFVSTELGEQRALDPASMSDLVKQGRLEVARRIMELIPEPGSTLTGFEALSSIRELCQSLYREDFPTTVPQKSEPDLPKKW